MIAPLVVRSRGVLRTARPMRQVLRAVASTFSAVFAIMSFRYLPVAEATAIIFAAPIFVTAMAIIFLGETVGIRRWAAAIVGLVGVVGIVQPGTDAFQPATLIPLIGAVMSASAIITTRMMRQERIVTTMAYSAFATIANLAQILAYRYASASLLLPFVYTS